MKRSRSTQTGPGQAAEAGKTPRAAAALSEGRELDLALERLREAETSRGWAIRQARALHRNMQRCHGRPDPEAHRANSFQKLTWLKGG